MAAAPPGPLSFLALLVTLCLLAIIVATVVLMMVHRRRRRRVRAQKGAQLDAWAEAGRRVSAPGSSEGGPEQN